MAPLRVIPPPLAVASVGEAVSPSVMLMSSTLTVVLLSVVVVPLTVKLPESVKDAADMAKVLLNLSQNRQQLKEVGISAHKLLAESFSVDVMAKKYNEIYKQLLISD